MIYDPEHWRSRAEETRTLADLMQHDAPRQALLRTANEYDLMAQRAMDRLRSDVHHAAEMDRLRRLTR